jgi:hypothetical protein
VDVRGEASANPAGIPEPGEQ